MLDRSRPGAAASPVVNTAVDVLADRHIVALTGAGISTDSGIPDYRGPDSPPRTPMTYDQFVGDPDRRRHYWARNHVGWRHVHQTRPNAGHAALSRMEGHGAVGGVITQNVDTLHELAGSRNVIDLHGRYDRVICLNCSRTVSRDHLAARLESLNPGFSDEVPDAEIAPDADAVVEATAHFQVADCEYCGGVLKPDIVYFGENVPKDRVGSAYTMVDSGDALLVAGSSLAVMSGLRFVRHAHKTGRPVVIVNRGPTRGDDIATVKIDGGCSPVLSEIADALR